MHGGIDRHIIDIKYRVLVLWMVKGATMNLGEFLTRAIDAGIDAARRDYASDPRKLLGAVDGFSACRGKAPQELWEMLLDARNTTHNKLLKQAEDYWFWRCREMEIEWMCNVASAIMMQHERPLPGFPTARGVLAAAKLMEQVA